MPVFPSRPHDCAPAAIRPLHLRYVREQAPTPRQSRPIGCAKVRRLASLFMTNW
jgi:hypothetical protein